MNRIRFSLTKRRAVEIILRIVSDFASRIFIVSFLPSLKSMCKYCPEANDRWIKRRNLNGLRLSEDESKTSLIPSETFALQSKVRRREKYPSSIFLHLIFTETILCSEKKKFLIDRCINHRHFFPSAEGRKASNNGLPEHFSRC